METIPIRELTTPDKLRIIDNSHHKSRDNLIIQDVNQTHRTKLILAYTNIYGNPFDIRTYGRSGYSQRTQPDPLAECEYSCTWSTDRKDYGKSDAVLFHLYNNLQNKDFVISDLPPRNNSDQLWIFMAREPQAFYFPDQMKQLDNLFNLTMTFLRDSDVTIPYGHYWPLPESSRAYRAKMKMDYLGNKTKLIAWVASNCITSSRREAYVKELQQHVTVDVYGKCGNLSTASLSVNGFRDQIAKEYMFYLAFENSDCDDYISEKFWNSLTVGMIPIVRGHRAKYKELAPPHSYIHADSFISTKRLAEHLTKISKDRTLFQQYHEWRRLYDGKYQFFTTNSNWPCQLCQKVHTTPQKLVRISEHWNEDTRCFTYLDYGSRNRTGEHVEDVDRK